MHAHLPAARMESSPLPPLWATKPERLGNSALADFGFFFLNYLFIGVVKGTEELHKLKIEDRKGQSR